MGFKFRLEKVLVLRQDAVDRAHMEMVKAQLKLKEAIEALDKITAELKFRHEELIRNNYEMAQDHLRVIKKCKEKLEKAKEEKQKAEEALVDAKAKLFEAQKKLEILQKLKEKQSEAYYLEMNRIEQKETDEKNALKFATELLKGS